MPRFPDNPEPVIDAIAALAKKYKKEFLLPILDQAEPSFEWMSEDWGVSYYRLVLDLPFEQFAVDSSTEVTEEHLAQLATEATATCSDGRVTQVSIASLFDAPKDWRSGAKPVIVSLSDADRIWKQGYFRLFLSHETIHKVKVGELKEKLAKRNVDAFVAHADIEPSKVWQQEIEIALSSCHAVAALVTPTFHESVWCMQEVGWGLGRGVLVQPIKLPNDPRGFVGSLQAIPGDFNDLTFIRNKLIRVFATNSRTRRQMHEPLVSALETVISTAQAALTLSDLEATEAISVDHANRIANAAASNINIKSDKKTALRATTLAKKYLGTVSEPPRVEDEYDPFADE